MVRKRKEILKKRLSKYLLVGIWNAIFSLSFYYFLLSLLSNKNYQLALLISYIISTLQAHYSQRKLVWKSSTPYLRELVWFSAGVVGQYLVNAFLLLFLVEILNISPKTSQPFVAILVAALSYFYNKDRVFKGAE